MSFILHFVLFSIRAPENVLLEQFTFYTTGALDPRNLILTVISNIKIEMVLGGSMKQHYQH